MIPRLDSRGNPCVTEPRWIRTPADDALRDCDSICIPFMGKRYPLWKFMEMYCRIVDKAGRPIAFKMNTAQIKTYLFMEKQHREIGRIRANEGKGRQMGSSTLISLILLTMMVTHPGYKVAILADTQEKGRGLLSKYKIAYKNLPKALKDALGRPAVDNSDKLSFDFGNGIISSVEVIVANENAGASYTFQAIHESEVALWENIDATITALEQTVADVDDTIIVRETTARGPNTWKNYYESGKKGNSIFKSIFLAWYLDDTYESIYDGHDLNQYERETLQGKLGLSLNKIQWWKNRFVQLHEDLALIMQEFPSTETEMWRTTSVSKFGMDIIDERKEATFERFLRIGTYEYEQPKNATDEANGPIAFGRYMWLNDPYGDTIIYEEPIEGHPYALCCDPAQGGSDYTACHVIDTSNLHQVAVFHKTKVDDDVSAYKCYCLYDYYKFGSGVENRVKVTGERNVGVWLSMMARLGCDMVYDRGEDLSAKVKMDYGYRTKVSNRDNMISAFAIAFREEKGRFINDYETLDEMETFQYSYDKDGNAKKLEAQGKAHDDLVMAMAGFFLCYVRGDFETDVAVRAKQKEKKFAIDPFSKGKKAEEEHFMVWR